MIETVILIGALIATGIALFTLIPKEKIRSACLVLMFTQAVTWLFGLVVVELRWLEYPYRLMHVGKTSLEFEYVVYPVITAIFVLRFPEQVGWLWRGVYYLLCTAALTGFEWVLEEHTDLIEYTGWAWYWTFVTVGLTFYVTRRYYVWFQKVRVSG